MGSSLSHSLDLVKRNSIESMESVAAATDTEWETPRQVIKAPVRVELLCEQPSETREEQLKHAWNSQDRSLNIYVKEDCPFTFHRQPVSQSTDCIRGKQGYSTGLHLIEFTWPRNQRGSHAVIGVGTRQAPLQCTGYESLLGCTSDSWGWDLSRGKVLHNSENKPGVTYPQPPAVLRVVSDRVLMVLDVDLGTLAFIAEGSYLGIAHKGLKGQVLYPMVSSLWGHSEVCMKHLAWTPGSPPGLSAFCRRSIRRSVGRDGVSRGDTDRLGLPTKLHQYIQYL